MINSILARSTIGAPVPEIGMGATILWHSDREAGTIVALEHFKTGARAGQVKAIHVQLDTAQRIDGKGMSESQEYIYLPDPNGSVRVFTLRKNGSYTSPGGITCAVGYRRQYYDFSY